MSYLIGDMPYKYVGQNPQKGRTCRIQVNPKLNLKLWFKVESQGLRVEVFWVCDLRFWLQDLVSTRACAYCLASAKQQHNPPKIVFHRVT